MTPLEIVKKYMAEKYPDLDMEKIVLLRNNFVRWFTKGIIYYQFDLDNNRFGNSTYLDNHFLITVTTEQSFLKIMEELDK